MDVLSHINSSSDVKKLEPSELDALCAELREAIIASVAQNGGHLASNLGAVELTVALHRVYDTKSDRIVFDVGHQCYAHKMLTGRLERFEKLRRLDGLSGFPKPCESGDDACIAGHASTSISNALGMARARTLLGENYDVAAVIGDGALTGGLAYEGLNDCGESREPIVVILNDNGMSINSNVGGLSRFLAKQRVKPSYLAIKSFYHRTIGRSETIYRMVHRLKEWIKDLILPDNMFEDMGFYYLGPIDGHDVKTLERTIRYARSLKIPVLVHVITQKGKGYAPAEADPETYHGVSSFDRQSGVKLSNETSFSAEFGKMLEILASEDDRVVAVTAAMGSGTGLGGFAKRFPERFFDVGIAEEHAVSMCAGMAKQGLRPVFAVYSSFLQRGYDMLLHDVSLDRLPVVLGVDRAGLVGADGETHQGCFDVSYLSSVPGLRVYAPSNYAEMRSMLRMSLKDARPAAIRYPRGGEGDFRKNLSAQDEAVIRGGDDVTIVSYGIMINQAIKAAEMLADKGVSAELIKLQRLERDCFPCVKASAEKTGVLIVLEDSCAHGCIGDRALSYLVREHVALKAARLRNLGSGVVAQGAVQELWKKCGIDAEAVAAAALEALEEKNEKGKT